jgi:hypothetical protein
MYFNKLNKFNIFVSMSEFNFTTRMKMQLNTGFKPLYSFRRS